MTTELKIRCAYSKLVDLTQLIPNPLNANQHPDYQIETLAKIIEYQGMRSPIVVSNRSGFITKGHGRLEALKLLDVISAPVDFQDYDNEAQEYADIIADNEIAKQATLDFSKVNKDMIEFGPELNIDMLGIKDFKIEPAEKNEGLTDEDEVPEIKNVVTKKGDIWLLGSHRLKCGDSTFIDDVEDLMNGEKADMVFTDPPYGVDYEGIKNDSRDGLSDLLDKSFSNLNIIMRVGASIYCFHSDKCADIFHEHWHQNFHLSSINIWVKPSLVMGGADYQSKHEPCFYGWKKGDKHKWQSDRKQTTVWEFGRDKKIDHTTPKPVEMVSYCIENSSEASSLVVDAFLGSGSTLIACEKTNRKCYGMELDEKYCDVIINRWQNYTGKKATLESTNQTYDELKSAIN